MPYLTVEDFKFGMDRRRKRVAGTPGTLWLGKDIHISRGGDVERRKKFDPTYHVPGTFGIGAVRSQTYVFGSADLAAAMPSGVVYQPLVSSGFNMVKVHDVKTFAGKLYVIAEYDDGGIYHFYNGSRVVDWDVVGAANASFEALATALAARVNADSHVSASSVSNIATIQAAVPGVPFSISASTINGTTINDQTITLLQTQANVPEVDEVRAHANLTISGGDPTTQVQVIQINGVDMLPLPVLWSGSDASTAIRLAAAINNGFSTHGYSAAVLGSVVTVSAAPGTGSTPNGFAVLVITGGTAAVTADPLLAGGITAQAPVAQIYTATFGGTFEPGDVFSIVVNGTTYKLRGFASGIGTTAFVSKNRVWSPTGSLWNYCMINRADIWDKARTTFPEGGAIPALANDAGFINIAAETEGNENLVVAARYQGLAAIFSSDNITLFQLDQDPANFAFSDVLENTGTGSAHATVRYGNNDVFYLDITGIRSLRARDASNAPFVSDVGNSIDTFVQDYIATLTKQQLTDAVAAIEPRDGRYWLVIGDRIFVLSYFPGAKISAWSYYEPTELGGNPVQNVIRVGGSMMLRAGDFIYVYGGLGGEVYPADGEVTADVQLPFLGGKTAATIKALTGFDLAAENTWSCEVAFDPNDDTRTVNIGGLSRITFADPQSIAMPGETSMVAPRLQCSKGGPASISMLAIHYQDEGAA